MVFFYDLIEKGLFLYQDYIQAFPRVFKILGRIYGKIMNDFDKKKFHGFTRLSYF